MLQVRIHLLLSLRTFLLDVQQYHQLIYLKRYSPKNKFQGIWILELTLNYLLTRILSASVRVNTNKELKVVPLKKTIFIGRFASETTAEDNTEYVKLKLNRNIQICSNGPLNTKLPSILVDSFNFHFHFIVFTETWLNDSINNSELQCSKYQSFRCDRTDKSKKLEVVYLLL